MKCWKCEMELPDGASVCTYCSTSTSRRAPVTEAGRAMRKVYDHLGSSAVFAKRSMLPMALGDMLEDSRMLRNQIDMALSNGVSALYARQLKEVGKPDADFYSRVKRLMTEDAGLSDAVATKLTGYFDEMIGWPVPAQTTARTTGYTAGSAAAQAHSATRTEIPRPRQNTEIPRPTPKPAPTPTPKPTPNPAPTLKIPLPTAPVPVAPGDDLILSFIGFIKVILWLGCAFGGLFCLFNGLLPVGILLLVIAWFTFTSAGKYVLKFVETNEGLEISWEGKLDKFAIAINGQWITTGSGNKILLSKNQLEKVRSSSARFLLAEITSSGVAYRDDAMYPKNR